MVGVEKVRELLDSMFAGGADHGVLARVTVNHNLYCFHLMFILNVAWVYSTLSA